MYSLRTSEKNSNLAHAWANGLGSRKGSNMFIDKDTIYSYGYHFPIAKHVTNDKGENAVLFTTRTYSNTTAKHIHIVRMATSHKNIIYCTSPDASHSANLESFQNKIVDSLAGLLKAKKPEKYIMPAERILEQAKKYTSFFGIDLPSSFEDIINRAKSGKYAEYLKEREEEIKRKKEEERIEAIKDHKSKVSKWRKGKLERLYSRVELVDYLRYNTKNKRVETSQGVEIPEMIAKKAFNWILSTIKNGGCLGECKYKILDFEVSEVTKDFIKIGCHTITLKEINKLAKQLSW